jgi:hypothetical protein
MRLNYTLNSVFFRVMGYSGEILALLTAIHKLAERQPSGGFWAPLTANERAVLKNFIEAYPDDLKQHIGGHDGKISRNGLALRGSDNRRAEEDLDK